MRFNSTKYNSHWQEKKLNDLGEFNRGKSRHRPRDDKALYEGGEHPLIQTGEVKAANLYISNHAAAYNDFGLRQSKKWPRGTLCITIAANIAETGLLDYPMCFPDSVVGFNAYSEESSELFMHYVFTFIRNAIQSSTSGSIQDNINLEYLTNLEFKIPTKKYQDKLVSILHSVDLKVELNNRINSELEAMVKTVYNYWFVQFDFQDENDMPYKSSGGKMIYDPAMKRDYPKGWGVDYLENVTELMRRGLTPRYVEEGGTLVLNQKCVRNQRVAFNDARRHSEALEQGDDLLLRQFDLLVNSTGVGTLGRVAFIKRLTEENTTFDSHVTVVRANKNKVSPDYLAWSILRLQPAIEAAANGSTGQVELDKTLLEGLKIVVPSRNLQLKFSEFVQPIIEKMSRNEEETENLLKLRDWLLPLLMNGQVTVK